MSFILKFIFASILLFSPALVFGAEQKGWVLSEDGDILSATQFTPYSGAYYYLGKSLNPNSGSFPTCSGGSSGVSSNISINNFIGTNVFIDGGLGEGTCTATGTYYMVFTNSSPFNTVIYYYALTYDGVKAIPNLSPVNTGGGFSPQLNTRFLSMSIANATTSDMDDVNFIISYYLDPTEIDRNNNLYNPTQIALNFANELDQISTYSFNISTTTGTSTVILRMLDSNLIDTETYDLLVTFYNAQSLFTDIIPFPDSFLSTTFTLTNHDVTNVQPIQNNNTFTLSTASFIAPQKCGLTNLDGCMINAVRFLLIPSDASVNNLFSVVTGSNIPLVATAYNSYSEFSSARMATGTSDGAFDIDLMIPAAGIDIPMFSIASTAASLGSTAPTFRKVTLVAVYLGFLSMFVTSINRMIHVTAKV